MKKWVKVLLIVLGVFFAIGAVSGNFHCTDSLSGAVSNTAGFACAVVKATCHGMTTVFNGIWGVFA